MSDTDLVGATKNEPTPLKKSSLIRKNKNLTDSVVGTFISNLKVQYLPAIAESTSKNDSPKRRTIRPTESACIPTLKKTDLVEGDFAPFQLPYEYFYSWVQDNLKMLSEAKAGPEKFRFIQHNQYVNKELKPLNDGNIEVCSCVYSNVSPACGDNCVLRQLQIECSKEHCPCYSAAHKCTNMRITNKQQHPLEVRHMGMKGWGLVITKPIKKGEFIVEYCGEILDEEECRQRLDDAYASSKHSYMLTLANGEYIDATQKGSVARFINHSCEPNSIAQKWNVNGEFHIGIFAQKDIKAESEITFDYKFERFGTQRQKCLCGTSKCRGYLGAKARKGDYSESDNSDSDSDAGEKKLDARKRTKLLDSEAIEDLQLSWEKNILVYPRKNKTKGNKRKWVDSVDVESRHVPRPVGKEWLCRNIRQGRKVRLKQMARLMQHVYTQGTLEQYSEHIN